MRLVLACFLAACSSDAVDDVVPRDFLDATTSDTFAPTADVFVKPEAEAGPVFIGGALACGKCTCDGTLYGCLEGAFGADASCISKGPPPPPLGDASDDDASCGKGTFCSQIPIACLPKPTCACIEKETNLICTIAQNGDGFVLQCP